MSNQSDYLDLPINLQDMAEQTFEPIKPELNAQPIEIAGKFIQQLQQLLSKGKTSDFHIFYENNYNHTKETVFNDRNWPEAHEIENQFSVQINISAQALYTELILRKPFEQIKPQSHIEELAEKNWENYLLILENIALKEHINLPASWIWDIINEFIHQLYLVSKWRAYKQNQGKCLDIWQPKKACEVLRGLYSTSIENGKLQLPQNPDCRDFLIYFGLVGHFRIEVMLGHYQEALDIISVISLDHTIVLSKAFGSQLSLFYNASFCYFMEEKYLEAAKLAQTIAIFYDKYKRFTTKTMNQKLLAKLNSRVLALWCLAHVFEGGQPVDTMEDLIKDVQIKTKERSSRAESLEDKLQKLKQFDSNTLVELFGFAAPKLITVKGTETTYDKKQLQKRLEDYMKFNFNTMLKLYTKIPLSKAARFLNLSENEVLKKIDDYGKRKIELSQDNQWNKTILKLLLKIEGYENITVSGGIVLIQRQTERKQVKDYANLMGVMAEATKKLQKL